MLQDVVGGSGIGACYVSLGGMQAEARVEGGAAKEESVRRHILASFV